MKLEMFFEKFEQFADAPNAVAKMRELILRLAVQGKLADPTDNDEPVEVFLRRIWADKSANRIELKDAEKAQPFDIPAHWRWGALAEVVDFSIGKTPPRGDSSYWHPEDHSWVSIADMKHYGTIIETKERVSSLAAQEVFRQRFAEPGSILMSFKLTIGKVARAGIRCFHNEAIISFKPPEPELGDYLFRFLPIFAALQTSNNAVKGSTLNKGLLTLLPVALPPLAEQKRIVAKVDELMALCDRLEAQQQERDTHHAALARASLARFAEAPTPANLDFLFHQSYTITPADLRKSILTLAVQGKLVPQDPNDESAANSFRKLSLEKIEADEDEFPEHWLRIPLGKLGEWRGGGTPSKSRPDFWKGEIPWVSPKDMKLLRIADAQDHISGEAVEKSSVRMIPVGSLLMVVRGMILARSFPVAITACDVTINQDMKALLPFERDTTEFILLSLRAFETKVLAAIEHSSHGTCKLQTDTLQAITMPIPPLAEQRRIVDKVDQLMALVDQLESQLAEAKAKSAALLEAVVHELLNPTTSAISSPVSSR